MDRLRSTYGDNLIVISAFSDKTHRIRRIAKKIADSINDAEASRHQGTAASLIQRDQIEPGNVFGQNVRDTFPLADLFVDATNGDSSRIEIERFFNLLFGHPVVTPARDEFGMFQAYGAALCSSAGRQVGAAIATTDGDIVSIGTNEVAKAFGGQYWAEDGIDRDHRDYKRPNANKAMLDSILADLFARLLHAKWLDSGISKLSPEELVSKAKDKANNLLEALIKTEEMGRPSITDKALLTNIIEFLRAVHAEMGALMSAARRGVSVDKCTLYSTTFPCHECARHIVAAGIRRVLFIEPYPKSRVAELYDDSISVDDREAPDRIPFEPFVGIAPRKYLPLFLMPDRGRKDDWEKHRREQVPRGAKTFHSYLDREKENAALLDRSLKSASLTI